MTKTLAIETSCDDTSLGIISLEKGFFKVEKLFAYSQISDHQKYGGVVPEIASRLHSEKILEVMKEIWLDTIADIDFISVTTHPGLPGSLVVWKAVATMLAEYFSKPLVEVNHIHGHIFSLLLERHIDDIQFPLAILTASWWHNDIYIVHNEVQGPSGLKSIKSDITTWWHDDSIDFLPISEGTLWDFKIIKIWQTLDDAAGECFDKVARMLWWPYPWWWRISDKASKWKANPDFEFKRIFLSKEEYNFSFSGTKSQASFLLSSLEKKWIKLSEQDICDIAYEFQESVVEVMAKKLIRAAIDFWAKSVWIAWWVSCNERLREYLNQELDKKNEKFQQYLQSSWANETELIIKSYRPMKKLYSTDNGAMIWVAGILKFLQK